MLLADLLAVVAVMSVERVPPRDVQAAKTRRWRLLPNFEGIVHFRAAQVEVSHIDAFRGQSQSWCDGMPVVHLANGFAVAIPVAVRATSIGLKK